MLASAVKRLADRLTGRVSHLAPLTTGAWSAAAAPVSADAARPAQRKVRRPNASRVMKRSQRARHTHCVGALFSTTPELTDECRGLGFG